MAACPWGPYLISLGEDGRLQVYNYLNRSLLHFHQFPAKGRALIWMPLSVDMIWYSRFSFWKLTSHLILD